MAIVPPPFRYYQTYPKDEILKVKNTEVNEYPEMQEDHFSTIRLFASGQDTSMLQIRSEYATLAAGKKSKCQRRLLISNARMTLEEMIELRKVLSQHIKVLKSRV